MPHPTLNPSLLLAPVANGYVAYDPIKDELHELNPLAALIVELCDGSRTAEEIAALMAPILPQGRTAEIAPWIGQATRTGVLLADSAAAASHAELSGDDLARLAWRLWDNGKIQTAFLCQQRAVELKPDNPRYWYNFAELALMLGRREDARAAYEKYLAIKPDDEEVKLLLLALSDAAPPPRVPDECIRQIYHHFSSSFDSVLVTDLKYCGPQRLMEVVTAAIGDRHDMSILDMGCGSGLSGISLKPRASLLAGIDLSPEMVELARGRNLYDRLDVAEITAWLRGSQDRFDLIVACDSLIYFGDLGEVARSAARLLRPGGAFAFTLERGDQHPYRLSDAGRYTHHPGYIREVAAAAGMGVTRLDEAFLRTEYNSDVIGLFAVLQPA